MEANQYSHAEIIHPQVMSVDVALHSPESPSQVSVSPQIFNLARFFQAIPEGNHTFLQSYLESLDQQYTPDPRVQQRVMGSEVGGALIDEHGQISFDPQQTYDVGTEARLETRSIEEQRAKGNEVVAYMHVHPETYTKDGEYAIQHPSNVVQLLLRGVYTRILPLVRTAEHIAPPTVPDLSPLLQANSTQRAEFIIASKRLYVAIKKASVQLSMHEVVEEHKRIEGIKAKKALPLVIKQLLTKKATLQEVEEAYLNPVIEFCKNNGVDLYAANIDFNNLPPIPTTEATILEKIS